jgi:hypothetical protein
MPFCEKGAPPGDVIYFTSEDPDWQVKELVRLAAGDLTRLHVHDIDYVDEPIDIVGQLPEMEEAINACGAGLVLIDAVNSFVGGDISSDSRARRTLSGKLRSLANRTGACVLGLRNWGRMEVGSASAKALGATSLSDVARCTMNTRKLPKEKGQPQQFALEFERISGAPPAQPVLFTILDKHTCREDEYLRTIDWTMVIPSDEEAEEFVEGLGKKVAEKGSAG